MSSKYKFTDKQATYFITAATVDWIDVFTRNEYREILLDSFRYCQKNQGLQIHAWVLMPNHFHMICSFVNDNHPQESRREWMLDVFEKNGTANKSNQRFQFWQHENHPVLLDTNEMLEQRFTYLHENPVRAGFVSVPEHWLYSSAIDYYTDNQKGLLDLVFLK